MLEVDQLLRHLYQDDAWRYIDTDAVSFLRSVNLGCWKESQIFMARQRHSNAKSPTLTRTVEPKCSIPMTIGYFAIFWTKHVFVFQPL